MGDGGLLPHLDRARILEFYRAAPGRELDGKFLHPESSASLVANALGFFLDGAEPLLEALGLEAAGPAILRLEQCLRFPWAGGLHPWLDAVVETSDTIVAIESKRYEPFRGSKPGMFSPAYLRPVWGTDMQDFVSQRNLLMGAAGTYAFLDAAQLIKHALGLATQARERRKRAVLVYLHAEPEAWPDGRPISAEKIAAHRRECTGFGAAVADNFVAFRATDYRQLLSCLAASADPAVRLHAEQVSVRFAPL